MPVEQIILQGGALAVVCLIAYVLVRYLVQQLKDLIGMINELVTNHLAHSDEVLNRVCSCMDKNTEALKELKNKLG